MGSEDNNRFEEREVKKILDIKNKTINVCKKCSGGWIDEDKFCDCRKSFLFFKEMIYSRIPVDYWFKRITKLNLNPISSKAIIHKYLEFLPRAKEGGQGICLIGPNGVGKTSVLAEIGKEAIVNNLRVVYLTAQNYIDYKMLNNYKELDRIEKDSDIILLDEIDKPYKKKGSDYVISQIENLLRESLPKDIIVCIASNWTTQEIKEYLGDSVFSIMNRKIKFLTLTGEDASISIQDEWMEKLNQKNVDYLSEDVLYFSKRLERVI